MNAPRVYDRAPIFPTSSYYLCIIFFALAKKTKGISGSFDPRILKRHARCPCQVSSYPLFVHERGIKNAAKYVRNAPIADVLKSSSQKGGIRISCPAKPQNAFRDAANEKSCYF